jgi:hypothetical protein
MPNSDVISAFLDNEPFDAGELASVLSEPDGRATLLQLIGLRHIVQPSASDARTALPARRRPLVRWLQAAVVLLAVGAGYALGVAIQGAHGAAPGHDLSAPPRPTIVVHRTPDAQWQAVRGGE